MAHSEGRMMPNGAFGRADDEWGHLSNSTPAPTHSISSITILVLSTVAVLLLSAGAIFACAAFSRRHPASSIMAAIKTKAQILIVFIVSYYLSY